MLSSSMRLATTQDENASASVVSARKAAATPSAHRRAFADAANKTPSTHHQRRAFGDISNKKAPPATAKPPPLLKSNSTTALTKQQANNSTSKTTIKKQQRAASTKQRRVEFLLPDEIEEPVPDVELPAGRLWSQQPDWDDLHDDDDDVSLEGASTVRQDALRFVQERHKLQLQLEDEHDEFCIKDMEESARQFMMSQGTLVFQREAANKQSRHTASLSNTPLSSHLQN